MCIRDRAYGPPIIWYDRLINLSMRCSTWRGNDPTKLSRQAQLLGLSETRTADTLLLYRSVLLSISILHLCDCRFVLYVRTCLYVRSLYRITRNTVSLLFDIYEFRSSLWIESDISSYSSNRLVNWSGFCNWCMHGLLTVRRKEGWTSRIGCVV